jgi:hypothetical protein
LLLSVCKGITQWQALLHKEIKTRFPKETVISDSLSDYQLLNEDSTPWSYLDVFKSVNRLLNNMF